MNPNLAEFLGTMLLVTLGDGVVAGVLLRGTKSENAGWLTVVVGWGLAVTLSIYAVGAVSGAHLNPAVTLAFAMKGDFPWTSVPGYVAAQTAGAFAGAVLVWLQYNSHWRRTEDPATKLAVFCTGPAIRSTMANFVSEMVATMILILGLLFLGSNHFADGLNPLAVGGLIISIGLSLGGTTGFAINPARDLGPRIAHALLPIPGKGSSDWQYSWIPVLGPLTGAILGVIVFNLFFV